MGTGYDRAPKEVIALVEKVMHDSHLELETAEVTVQVLFAHKYDKDGNALPAMMVRGQMALAKTSITNLQDRTRGIPDAKLVIDRTFGWERLADARRVALIDHELTHLNLTLDQDGVVKLDDRGRPKLHMRHHDFEFNYFHEVAQRHGEASIEAQQVARFNNEFGGQLELFKEKATKEVKVNGETAKV